MTSRKRAYNEDYTADRRRPDARERDDRDRRSYSRHQQQPWRPYARDSRRSPPPASLRREHHGSRRDDVARGQRPREREEGELPYDEDEPLQDSAAHSEPSMDLDAMLDQPKQPEPDAAAVMAEKRRRRAEIMAKYASQDASPLPPPSPIKRPKLDASDTELNQPGANTPEDHKTHPETSAFDLAKHEGEHVQQPDMKSQQDQTNAQNEISAASYNPDEDRKQDALRQLMHQRVDESTTHGQAAVNTTEEAHAGQESEIEIEVTDDEDQQQQDGGEEEEDDMFALATEEAKPEKVKKTKKIRVKKSHGAAEKVQASGMVVIDRHGEAAMDDADDAEGYYRVILGEVLDAGRYHVHANLGKGVFSSVVRAKDNHQNGKEVAIKIIRSQETMYKAGQKEANILYKLAQADPADKKHVIRLLRTFDHRNHLCLVFESMALNLREVVKRYGKDVGINLKAVRAYAHQMFLGLSLLRKCNLMHADLKPDNVLVTENHTQLKISDLGSASDTSENDITPYLVSRFYRAPEIILGLPYDCALDMWSIGCTLYELYTGKILLPGRNNNHMLLHIQELKGRFNNRFLKKARFADQHFDELGNFVTTEVDKTTGSEKIVKKQLSPKPTADLRSRLAPPAQLRRMAAEEVKQLNHFVDLLDKALDTDPSKRLTPKDALNHPFLR